MTPRTTDQVLTLPVDGGLIERLEKATEGSRALDAAIYVGSGEASSRHTDETSCRGCGCAPRYSTSIDAALTLVPKGWGISGFTNCTIDQKYLDVRALTNWTVSCARIGESFAWRTEAIANIPTGIAPTPAISLCIAALKARHSLRARSAT